MQPVYRFSLLSGKVSIIDGFGNDIALPVIQHADRNIMHTQLPQIVQRDAQKQAQLHADNTAVRYNRDILLVAFTLEDIVKSRDSDALHHESFRPAAESIRPDASGNHPSP